MIAGQMLWIPRTGARVEIEEVHPDQSRAIARGYRNGGRLMVIEEPSGYYVRSVTDNGASGTSLFASLVPVGPRYAAKSVTR